MSTRKKITLSTLRNKKRQGQRISMLTCYDYSTARLMEEAGVDGLLVGDTYAEVCLGHPSTLPATMDHMVVIAEAVRRGAPTAYLIGDMPYLSYQVTPEDAIRHAGRFMAEAQCDCVKVEVDRRLVKTVERMAAATIPVMAHLGLGPQSVPRLGGYKVQGKDASDAVRLLEDVRLMEKAGAVSILLEAVSTELAAEVTASTSLPVIGCVSGPQCDGQVVVLHDMLGFGVGHPPRAVRPYTNLHDVLIAAFRAYTKDILEGRFPALEDSVSMPPEEHEAFLLALGRSLPQTVGRE